MLHIIAIFVVVLSVVAVNGSIVCSNDIVAFNALDASVSPPIVRDLTFIVALSDFSSCTLDIETITTSAPPGCDDKPVKCVKFFLDGALVRKEKAAPYTYFGSAAGSSINAHKPPIGNHKLKACTYSDEACSKDESGCKEMKVEFVDCDHPTSVPSIIDASINKVVGFELVNTVRPNYTDITLFTPPIINLSEFPSCSLNIIAAVNQNNVGDAKIKCVKMMLGDHTRKENVAPYTLYGNSKQFFHSGKPKIGEQTLKACTLRIVHVL